MSYSQFTSKNLMIFHNIQFRIIHIYLFKLMDSVEVCSCTPRSHLPFTSVRCSCQNFPNLIKSYQGIKVHKWGAEQSVEWRRSEISVRGIFWIKSVKYGGGSGHIITISGHKFHKILQHLFAGLSGKEENKKEWTLFFMIEKQYIRVDTSNYE